MATSTLVYAPNTTTPAPAQPASAAAQTAGQFAAGSQLPGYSTSVGNIGNNIASETAGNVPDDVKYQLAQAAAERGVATGNPNGANTNAQYLQSLGLTSLNLTNQGQQNLESILPSLPGYSLSQNPSYYENVQQQLGQYNLGTSYQQQQQAQQAAQAQAQAQALAQNKAAQAGLGANTAFGSPITAPPTTFSPGIPYNTADPNANAPYTPNPNQFQSDGEADPYAAWSQANPWASIASKYSGTVTGGANQDTGAEDFGNADLSQEQEAYYNSPEFADISGGL